MARFLAGEGVWFLCKDGLQENRSHFLVGQDVWAREFFLLALVAVRMLAVFKGFLLLRGGFCMVEVREIGFICSFSLYRKSSMRKQGYLRRFLSGIFFLALGGGGILVTVVRGLESRSFGLLCYCRSIFSQWFQEFSVGFDFWATLGSTRSFLQALGIYELYVSDGVFELKEQLILKRDSETLAKG